LWESALAVQRGEAAAAEFEAEQWAGSVDD